MTDARADRERRERRAEALAVSLLLHAALGWWLLRPGAPMPGQEPEPPTIVDLSSVVVPEPVLGSEAVTPVPAEAAGGGGGSPPAPAAQVPIPSPVRAAVIAPPPAGTTPTPSPQVERPTPTPVPIPDAFADAVAPVASPVPIPGGGGGSAGTGSGFGTGDGSRWGSGSGGGRGAGTGDGSGAGGARTVGAVWIRRPSDAVLSDAYPFAAMQVRQNGGARLSCRVNRFRRPVDCRVVKELPAGHGFGRAALSVVRREGLVRPPVAADPEEVVRVAIVILFEPPPIPTVASE